VSNISKEPILIGLRRLTLIKIMNARIGVCVKLFTGGVFIPAIFAVGANNCPLQLAIHDHGPPQNSRFSS